jgi:hypothetical protein
MLLYANLSAVSRRVTLRLLAVAHGLADFLVCSYRRVRGGPILRLFSPMAFFNSSWRGKLDCLLRVYGGSHRVRGARMPRCGASAGAGSRAGGARVMMPHRGRTPRCHSGISHYRYISVSFIPDYDTANVVSELWVEN